jgi:4'-phosphopantetheinyl transferase
MSEVTSPPFEGPGKRIFWLTQTLAEVPETDDWLCVGERQKLAMLRFPKRRNDWRLGRWTAKRLVASVLESEAASLTALEIRAAPDGAPEAYLKGAPAPVSLSISHTEGTGFCVVAPPDVEVGCDLELVRAHEPSFAEDYFAGSETAFLRQAPMQQRILLTSLIWSAKESALKSLREGLRRDTRSVIVDIRPGQRPHEWNPLAVRCTQTNHVFPGWWRFLRGFVLTIASDQPILQPSNMD